MAAKRLTVRSERVVTPTGVRPAAVHVDGGVIVAVRPPDEALAESRVVDAGHRVVSPGLLDIHVHVNEPGRTEWEGFETATRAAAAGGVTTLIDMPLNSIPPTVSAEALAVKRAAAAARCHVDVGFWGGIVPGNAGELDALDAAGVFGFKAFLADSGVEEFERVTAAQLQAAMRRLASLDALTLVHAETAEAIAAATRAWDVGDPRVYQTYLASRPDAAERQAVAAVAASAARTGARVHVLHLSSADALVPLDGARAAGAPVTAETCPHYLALAAEEVPEGVTSYKCAPPIRDAANRERLWDALANGTLDLVASDHSPCPPALKRLDEGDFAQAWGGIASLQLGLSIVWSEARARDHGLADVARWMSAAPAALVGLPRKGAIAQGHDADLVIWDPDATWVVDGSALEHRHPVTPYEGMRLYGRVDATYLRGRLVYENGAPVGPPEGRLLAKRSRGGDGD